MARIWAEQLIETLRYGSPNEFYFPYGFDVKGRGEMRAYLHYDPFMAMRDGLNVTRHSATAVLRDKLLFGMYADSLGVATARNAGMSLGGGTVYDTRRHHTAEGDDFISSLADGIYFIKPVDGECGRGIVRLVVARGSYEAGGCPVAAGEIVALLASGRFLIQEGVEQHPVMAALHPRSLNTMRLVTVRDLTSGRVEVFPSILRIGTGDSTVDNTSQGGLAVGISTDTGRLMDYGYYKPGFGTRVEVHPDSGIRFADMTVPYFEEAKAQAAMLHDMLSGVHSIGWDVAVGPSGPVFVEGNDNWEINGPQICHGGLRQRFERLCGKR